MNITDKVRRLFKGKDDLQDSEFPTSYETRLSPGNPHHKKAPPDAHRQVEGEEHASKVISTLTGFAQRDAADQKRATDEQAGIYRLTKEDTSEQIKVQKEQNARTLAQLQERKIDDS